MYASGVSPLFELIIKDLHCTQQQASELTTYVLLTLGLSNLFALPLASLISKRYTILLSLVLFLATNIWSGEAPSYTSLLVSRILGGLAGGLIEALGPTIVAETFPQHQWARAMVVYVGFLAAGSALGPIIAGAVAHGIGDWRWYQRILAIAVAINLLGSIFILPETTHDSIGMIGPAMVEDGDADSKAEATANEFASGSGQELSPPNDGSLSQHLRDEWIKRSFSAYYVTMDWKTALLTFVKPLQLITLPQVLVTTLVFGLTIGWTVIIAVVVAVIYAPPPLLWSSLHVGLLSLAPLTGLLIGLPVGGALADMLFNREVKKFQEVHDPAVRLPAVIIGGLVSPAGCLVLGYGLQHPHTWIQVCVGWAMLAFGLTGSANVLLTYAVDSVPSRAGDIGTLLNVTKNSLGFGVSYASVSWMQKSGPVSQFATMAGLLWFCYMLVIPLWLWRAALVRLMARWF
ncbi:hypothetical protein BFJ63_vAg16387 [Fusarium oxysporum f. sp. narcissi]|uniref:Major facilitator superfamily (MFS) profile domain-containing protein n=1 Tax=Fusarium oxysporum f. sp. narcissi TaxID=451672 RepID=A0A4Q2V7L4_FUSOX|nr:hypothetical protein BFJ63_vAg16387 [Fusarium oxysporum f. sp. narcissi]